MVLETSNIPYCNVFDVITHHFFLPFLKILFSQKLERSVSSYKLVEIFVNILVVSSCITVTILLYHKFPSRNLISTEWNDAMVLIILKHLFIFLALALLPRTCDDFQRQKTFVLWILFFTPFFLNILFSLSNHSVHILSRSSLVRDSSVMYCNADTRLNTTPIA